MGRLPRQQHLPGERQVNREEIAYELVTCAIVSARDFGHHEYAKALRSQAEACLLGEGSIDDYLDLLESAEGNLTPTGITASHR